MAGDCRYIHSRDGAGSAHAVSVAIAGAFCQPGMRSHVVDQLDEIFEACDSIAGNATQRVEMILSRLFLNGLVCATLGTSFVSAADLSSYRGFQFGAQLSGVVQQAGLQLADAELLHQRPAKIQQLKFQPNLYHSSASPADPVSEILFRFYNGELCRMVVLYEADKVRGMTPEDMIQAISATYGTAERPVADVPYHSYSAESAPVIARWQDSQYSYDLVRAEDHSSYAIVLYSKKLDALAQAAMAESVRLDAQEAPQREAARIEKQAEANRVDQEKARLENKANFRP
jgi:hypothetical protein